MKLLTPKEAAEKLGVSTKTLRDMANHEKIEFVRLPSGHRRYPTDVVSRLMGKDHDVLNGDDDDQ